MSLLEVDRVASFYGDFQALFEVSLEVAEGETVAVIGANGAGKSTLLRTVVGLQDRATGTVSFDGRPLDGVPTHRRLGLGIAMVPEGRRIFPSLTVEENLKVGARRDRPGRWTVASVLELFDALADKRDRPGAWLSGGEQQRVSIARAFVNRPLLMLCDEPTGNLDPTTSQDIMRLLERINRTGTTVVMATHDERIVDQMRKRVVELEHGKVVRDQERGVYDLGV